MTTSGLWRRKPAGQRKGSVVGEATAAVRSGIRHVWMLKGLTVLQRFLVACLKIVAVIGYQYGKWSAAALAAASSSKPGAGHRNPKQAAAVAMESVSAAVKQQDQQQKAPPTLNGRPVLAVIMPVYAPSDGHLVRLLQALDGLSQQTRQPDYLVIVDDGSPLPIPSIISGQRVLVLRLEANSGPATARNAGLWAARRLGAQLACFIDADCTPEASWLGVMERAQRRSPGIVTGRTMASEPGTPVGLYHNVCGTLNGRRLADGTMLYGCTCNLSLNLSRVHQDFDMTFAEAAFEDVEYCVRARKAGVPMTYDADAIVRHHYNFTCLGLFRQFQRYGRYEGHMCRRHADYLAWLWSSADVSCLSSVGLPLKPSRNSPPTDTALCKRAEAHQRQEYKARGPLLGSLTSSASA